ncbi:MAG: RidA family protein [Candidatus Dormiibacterota bacterium]
MPRRELLNANLPRPKGYSRAVAVPASELIFTSMTAPVDASGEVVGESAELQAQQVLHNLRDILEQNGSGLDNVLKVSAYVTRQESASTVMRVIGDAFSSPPPAIALAVVTGLPNPAFLVEIDVVAVAG